MIAHIVPWLAAAPALAAVVAPLLGSVLGQGRRLLHPVLHLIVLALAILALRAAPASTTVSVGPSPVGEQFLLSLDRPTSLGILLAAILFFVVSTFSCGFIGAARHGTAFLSLLFLEQAAVNLVLLAGDLFVLYAGLLLLSLSLMMMVGIDFAPASRAAALRIFATPEVPALAALISFWLIDARSGGVAVADLAQRLPAASGSTSWALVVPIVLALVSRVGLFPLQQWVVVGCRSAATPVAVAIGAIAVPLGAVVFERLAGALVALDPTWLLVLALLGGVTVVIAGAGALGERSALGWLGYAALVQVGLAVAGFAAGPGLGVAGAWLGLVAGALAVSLLGLSLGLLTRATGQDEIGGPGRLPRSWVARLSLGLGFLAVAGVPPFPTFTARVLVLAGLLRGASSADSRVQAAVAALVVVGIFLFAAATWKALFDLGRAQPRTNGVDHLAKVPTTPELVPAASSGRRIGVLPRAARPLGRTALRAVLHSPHWVVQRAVDPGRIEWEASAALVVLAAMIVLLSLVPLSVLAGLVGATVPALPLAFGIAATFLLLLALGAALWLNLGWRSLVTRLRLQKRLSRRLAWLGEQTHLGTLTDPYLVVGGILLYLGRASAAILNNTLGRLARVS